MRTETMNRLGFNHARLLAAALVCWCAVLTVVSAPAADKLKIKLATLAPTGSTYHKSLLGLADSWKKITGGGVDLVIYGDGKLGGEADTVGLMGVNSIQAAMLTGVGLTEIEKAVDGLQSIPMGFHDLEEVDYIGEKLHPMLEQRLAKKGFVVLFWTDTGWLRFFSKKPVTRPDDLRKLKLFTWAGSADTVEIYKSAGFDPVPLETADILPGLQTGLINATPAPPVFALATQIYVAAPHMLEINWAPLVGACVIRKETWEKLPAGARDEMLKAAVKVGSEIKANARKESDDAVKAMEKRGLKVTHATPAITAEWRTTAEGVYPKIRGNIVPAEVFDEALRLIKEYRQQKRQP